MHWVARAVVGLLVGYLVGAILGYGAIQAFSSNVHDKDLEAAMTAAFATGPLGAALGVAVGLWVARRG